MSSTAIILAAGKSTRMKSNRAKPMHEICGKPMLEYVLQACYGAGCDHVLVVVGHGKEEVIAAFGNDPRIVWIEQTEQLGTGHAARMCVPWLKEHHHGDVFILAGDGPLIRAEVLQTLHRAHREDRAAASMATANLDDPSGYGRVLRDAEGNFVQIVEQVDCTPEQREIREVFPSYYCIKGDELLSAMAKLKNENSKGEFYLTDVYGILRNEGKKVLAVQAVSADDVLSVNSRDQQTQVDAIMQDRIQRQLLQSGVTIVSAVSTYIQSGVGVGIDTVIHPFTYIGKDSTIGSNCVIGPFVQIPAKSLVPEGTVVAGRVSREAFGG